MKTKLTLHRIAVILFVLTSTRLAAVLILIILASLVTGCKGVTKSFLGSEGGDSGAISIDSNSVYGKHQLRSMNPKPGYSGFIHPDGTMEMRWVGTNAAPAAPIVRPQSRLMAPPSPGEFDPLDPRTFYAPAPANSAQ